jgi:hypothetical protein
MCDLSGGTKGSEEKETRNCQRDNEQDQAGNRTLAGHRGRLAIARLFFDFGRGHSKPAMYNQRVFLRSLLFLEQAIKCGPGVSCVPRRLAHSVFAAPTRCSGGLRIARHGYARREELARIGLVLKRDANGDRSDALESGRGLEIHALLATVQSCVALRAFTFEVYIRC